jgi:hypothetical protein
MSSLPRGLAYTGTMRYTRERRDTVSINPRTSLASHLLPTAIADISPLRAFGLDYSPRYHLHPSSIQRLSTHDRQLDRPVYSSGLYLCRAHLRTRKPQHRCQLLPFPCPSSFLCYSTALPSLAFLPRPFPRQTGRRPSRHSSWRETRRVDGPTAARSAGVEADRWRDQGG